MVQIAASWYFLLSTALFGIGLVGILTQKSGIRILMCVEMMLNAANINFVAFSSQYIGDPTRIAAASSPPPSPYSGIVYAFFVIAIAAAEAAVGLAIFVNLYRVRQSIDLDQATTLQG